MSPTDSTPTDAQLEARLRLILPQLYRDRADEVQPVSMGSAALQYGPDGRIAWDRIWQSFCDLALAGGPPHRGTLLEPAAGDTEAVRAELCRGLHLVTGLHAEPAPDPCWVRMYVTSAGMAGWLARAIVTENVCARFAGLSLYLPAGPDFRVEKEIKNVITAVAKTSHYWLEHTTPEQHWEISAMLRQMQLESPLIVPGEADSQARSNLAQALERETGLRPSTHNSPGWLGMDCPSVSAAVLLMRLLVVQNLYARREQTTVFLPLSPQQDPTGQIVQQALKRAVTYNPSGAPFLTASP